MTASHRLTLREASLLRITGPAKLRVLEGQMLILGAIYTKGDEVYISEYRSYAVKALTDVTVDISLGPGASIEAPAPGEEVIDEWVYIVDSMLSRNCTKFIVIGPIDSGKTSLAALIANRALLRGMRPGIIDADVGQADIGPPGAVSAAIVHEKLLWLRELNPSVFRFIGSITPQRNERRIVSAIVDLYWRLKTVGAEVIIIDTDGWLHGPASIEYKIEAARLVGVDAVLLIEVGGEITRMMSSTFRALRCGLYELPSPKVKKTRSRDERRMLRSMAYKKFLSGAVPVTLSLEKLSLFGACILTGNRLREEVLNALSEIAGIPILAGSDQGDTVYLVVPENVEADDASKRRIESALSKQAVIISANEVKGLLVALLDENMQELGIGVIQDMDFRNGHATVVTRVEPAKIKGLIFGNIRLTEEFSETPRPPKCVV